VVEYLTEVKVVVELALEVVVLVFSLISVGVWPLVLLGFLQFWTLFNPDFKADFPSICDADFEVALFAWRSNIDLWR
jgi:hypothetical protein